MKQAKVRQLLEALHVKVPNAQRRSNWTVSQCPLGPWRHEGGKSNPEAFGVKDEHGDPHCNCFSCGFHGTLGTLLLNVKQHNKTQPRIEVKWGELFALVDEAEAEGPIDLDVPSIEEVLTRRAADLHVFPQWWLDSFPCAWDIPWARDYLTERHVPLWLAANLDIRADTSQQRVCFPIHDFKKRLVGLHGRAIHDGIEPRYRMYLQANQNNPIVWLGESWVDLERPIVVVEGPFDLASVKRVYDNVVSPLFVNPSYAKLSRMADALTWITLYDNGAGGDAGRDKVSKMLDGDHLIYHLRPPKGRKDPGEMQEQELIDILGPIVQLSAKKP